MSVAPPLLLAALVRLLPSKWPKMTQHMCLRGNDRRSDAERGRKRDRNGKRIGKQREKRICPVTPCRKLARRGWYCGFCQAHAPAKGCKKPQKKSKATANAKKAKARPAPRSPSLASGQPSQPLQPYCHNSKPLFDDVTYEDDDDYQLVLAAFKAPPKRIKHLTCHYVAPCERPSVDVPQAQAELLDESKLLDQAAWRMQKLLPYSLPSPPAMEKCSKTKETRTCQSDNGCGKIFCGECYP